MSNPTPKKASSTSSPTTSGNGTSNGTSKPYFTDSKQIPIKEDYHVQDMLGDGGFSVVKRGIRNSDGVAVAIKMIKKRKVNREDVEREVTIWRTALSVSDKVVQLYDIYEDTQHVNLVMELMSGGELFEKIVEMEDYSELYAAKIMKQVFYIIKDLHKADIVHQDLKPENLLLTSKDSMIIKLCDFGLAEITADDIELVGIVGSTTYMAPEVVAETGHGKPVDIYAAGVIMYILLCGYPPYEPENQITELEFPEPEWDDISETAKELITVLLDEDPDKRPTPDQVLRHKWFMDIETVREDKPKLLNNTVRTLRKFKDISPNGTMKEYRGRKEKASLFGLFPETHGTRTPNADHSVSSISPRNDLEDKKEVTKVLDPKPHQESNGGLNDDKAKEKEQPKPADNANSLVPPAGTKKSGSSGTFSHLFTTSPKADKDESPKTMEKQKSKDATSSKESKDTKDVKSKDTKDPKENKIAKSQVISIPKTERKDGHKKPRHDKDKRASVAVVSFAGGPNVNTGSKHGKKKSSARDKNQRASTSIVTLLQKEGRLEFDPIGMFANKTEKEQLQIALSSVAEIDSVSKNDKKKSQRRSARHEKPVSLEEDKIKQKHKSEKPDYKSKSPRVFDHLTPRISGEQSVLDALSTFQSELLYQRELSEMLKQEVETMKQKVIEEQAKTQQLEKKFNTELEALRKEVEEERKKRRRLEMPLELNNNFPKSPSTQTGVPVKSTSSPANQPSGKVAAVTPPSSGKKTNEVKSKKTK